jgi:methionyl-tRNA formyltransferase
MRIVFFGSPAFSVPSLRRLVHDSQFEVVLVVSQPDRRAGRGRQLVASPVVQAARELGISCYQPVTLRGAEERAPLVAAEADLFVVAAYGMIFGVKTLAIPRLGCVNVHASLLPRYRGASPIAAAILNGDDRTGVTLMRMEVGLDTGPMIAARPEPILPTDTTESLTLRLAEVGAELIGDALPRFAAGEIFAERQPEVGMTLTRPLTKADGWLDWESSAVVLERSVRAFWPWPRAWTTLGTEQLQVHEAAVSPLPAPGPPGTVMASRSDFLVACAEDALRLTKVQIAGGRPLSAADFLAGRREPVQKLGAVGEPVAQPPLIRPIAENKDR